MADFLIGFGIGALIWGGVGLWLGLRFARELFMRKKG